MRNLRKLLTYTLLIFISRYSGVALGDPVPKFLDPTGSRTIEKHLSMKAPECQNPLVLARSRSLGSFGCPSCGTAFGYTPQVYGSLVHCIGCATYFYPVTQEGEWIRFRFSPTESYPLPTISFPENGEENFFDREFKVEPVKAYRISSDPGRPAVGRDCFSGKTLGSDPFQILLLATTNETESHRIAALFPAFSVRPYEGGVALLASEQSSPRLNWLLQQILVSHQINSAMLVRINEVESFPTELHPLLKNAVPGTLTP
jgi:hypothetical protein